MPKILILFSDLQDLTSFFNRREKAWTASKESKLRNSSTYYQILWLENFTISMEFGSDRSFAGNAEPVIHCPGNAGH